MYKDIDLSKIFHINSSKITDEQIKKVEEKIGYKLPKSYIEFLKITNGGDTIENECWLSKIYGIGDNENGLEAMYDLWINEWQYPKIGIPFGETQTAGHDIYFMDFRERINDEPRIIRIDQEYDYEEYLVASNFEDFLRKLSNNEDITGVSLKPKNKEQKINKYNFEKPQKPNIVMNILAIILFVIFLIVSIIKTSFTGIIVSSVIIVLFISILTQKN